MVQLLQKMSLLLEMTPPCDVRTDVLPLLYRALETDTPAIQEMCLCSLPECAKHIDKQTMKTQVAISIIGFEIQMNVCLD